MHPCTPFLRELEGRMPEGNTSDADKARDTKASFMGIPIKGWAIAAISLIVVCYAAGHFGVKLYYELQGAKT